MFVRPDLRHHLTVVHTRTRRPRNHRRSQHTNPGILRPRHVIKGLIKNREVRHAFHDRITAIHNRVRNRRSQRVIHLSMLLRPADETRKIRRIRPAQRIMQAHQSASTLHIRLKLRLLLIGEVRRISLVKNHHIRMLEIGSARPMQRPIHDGSMLGENLAPICQKLRIVMLTGKVRLQSRPDIDMHALRILIPG